MPADQRSVYTVAEIAQKLGISTDKIYELLRANSIPHKRVGRRYLRVSDPPPSRS